LPKSLVVAARQWIVDLAFAATEEETEPSASKFPPQQDDLEFLDDCGKPTARQDVGFVNLIR
jgi:hypothetical protein